MENFDEWSLNEILINITYKLIVGFIGETLREKSLVGKTSWENFDESMAICQFCQSFPPSNFCTICIATILS